MTDFRDVDIAVLEIGHRDGDNTGLESKAALSVFALIQANPDVKFVLAVGGWDDDLREVWEIPEALECIKLFAKGIRMDDWSVDSVRRHFEEQSIAVLLKCGAWHPPYPIEVTITGAGHA